jgi:hypothetical protein
MKQDIPLKDAVFAWNYYDPKNFKAGDFQVYRLGDQIPDHLECTTGAVYSGWQRVQPQTRLNLFLREIFKIALSSHAPIHYIRNKLLAIPEYRKLQEDAGLDQLP